MAHECTNEMVISGPAGDVDAFVRGAGTDSDSAWNMGDAGLVCSEFRSKDGTRIDLTYAFSTFGRPPVAFEHAQRAAVAHPAVVVTTAVVELGFGYAEAKVYKGAEILGEYSMSENELREVAGVEHDGDAVMDDLLSTVNAYAEDALEVVPAAPAP